MKIKTILSAIALIACNMWVNAGELDINDSGWAITFDSSSKTLTYNQGGKDLIKRAFIQALNGSEATLDSKLYPNVTLTSVSINDVIGKGTKYTYTYSGLAGSENLEQSIYIYSDKGYLLVDAAVVATSGTAKSHYIAPIVSTTSNTFLPSSGANYVYDMPHDNDNWVGYSAQPWSLGVANTSCEVSAFYDIISREGLIIGSIEHDNWKSGITATPNGSNRLRNLTVAAGVVSKRTNDIWDGRPSIDKHGSISGARVVSPRYFFGYYADWRNGLEDLGVATEKLCPKLPWNGGTIFAWQSWGGMAEHVNYEGAVDVSDFFHGQLEPNNFHNENGVCYIVLDSFWDNFSDDQLRSFAQHCKANGQHPGIYHTPFSYWGNEEQAAQYRPYDGCPYTWGDMAIKANGKMRKIASIALDPTHPGTIGYNKNRFTKFKDLGFEYIKLDFINNGTLEADDFYADGVTTGMQAYTYGMDKVLELADGMFVDLSIAPVFPAKGHARRLSCDAWGELSNSMYSLNSLNLSWWLDRLYDYNDPDHLVLSKAESEGAARIRYSCGAMTGTVLLGDNYSLKGSYLGKQSERDLAMKVATNADINAIAHIGRSFRPVEGSLQFTCTRWQYTYGVDNQFVLDTEDALYYAIFNYDQSNALNTTADFARIGIDKADVKSIKELWTGTSVSVGSTGFSISIPKCDVRIYRIEKVGGSSVSQIENDTQSPININYISGSFQMEAPEAIASSTVYKIDGTLQKEAQFSGNYNAECMSFNSAEKGLYMVKCNLKSGISSTRKIFVK